MLQNLLMERLRLTFHVQTKILPGYELVAGPAGVKLKESRGGVAAVWRAAPPAILFTKGHVRATFRDTTILEFAQYLGTRLGTRFTPGPAPVATRVAPVAVLDKTGLEGHYDFTFDDSANLQGLAYRQGKDSPGSGLGRALDAQLGLKLVPAKVAVDVLVVDHVEKTPAAN
jgi:uncharacterized protein (TIGR03435 family)